MDKIKNLVNEEINRSTAKYGELPSLLHYAMLINKESNEITDFTLQAYDKLDQYRIWAITHNLIQEISACIKYLNYLEKNGLDIEKFNMEKPDAKS